jgi:hypothetical protein
MNLNEEAGDIKTQSLVVIFDCTSWFLGRPNVRSDVDLADTADLAQEEEPQATSLLWFPATITGTGRFASTVHMMPHQLVELFGEEVGEQRDDKNGACERIRGDMGA